MFDIPLQSLQSKSLLRKMSVIDRFSGKYVWLAGRPYVACCSNDYLGLSEHPMVIHAMHEALKAHGTGGRSSRLVLGNTALQEELEDRLRQWKGAEACLLFSCGMMANLGIIPVVASAIEETSNVSVEFVFDELCHASIIDGVRLSRRRWRRFKHNDMDDLAKKLSSASDRHYVVITEAVFSMEGSMPPLMDLVALCHKQGAILIVDEAHANGVFGAEGEGTLKKYLETDANNIIVSGTFGKAIGTYGAYVLGTHALRNLLINKARTFIYTTALPPAIIAGTLVAMQLVRENPVWRSHLLYLSEYFQEACAKADIPIYRSPSHITSVITRTNDLAHDLETHLRSDGFFVKSIRPPTVPVNTSRLRFTWSRFHQKKDIDLLVASLHSFFKAHA